MFAANRTTNVSPLDEIRQIHGEVVQMHAEMTEALRDLRTLLAQIKALRHCDEETRTLVQRLENRLERAAMPVPRLCGECGAPLTRHVAEAGDLLVCNSCGWSEFVDRTGHVLAHMSSPEPPPPSTLPAGWVREGA